MFASKMQSQLLLPEIYPCRLRITMKNSEFPQCVPLAHTIYNHFLLKKQKKKIKNIHGLVF